MNAPSSISPYVAKASVVAGVHTGMLISAASDHLPALAAIWNRATPGLTVAVRGKRTSTRSLAGTVTRRPRAVVTALGGGLGLPTSFLLKVLLEDALRHYRFVA